MPGEEGGEFIVKQLQNPLRDYVRNARVLRDADGRRVRVDDSIRVTNTVVNHLSVDEIKAIKGRRPLHPAQRDIHKKLKSGATTHDFYDHLTNDGASDVFEEIAGTDRAPSVFAAILEELAQERRSYQQRRALETTGLLTADGRAVGHSDENVFLPPVSPDTDRFDTDPFEDVKSELRLLSLEVRSLAGEHAEIVFENIELNRISSEEIVRIWVETVDLLDHTPSDRRRAVEFCFAGVQGETFDADDIEGLLLETRDNEWREPEDIFLPVAYEPAQPAHRLSEFNWLVASQSRLEFSSFSVPR